METQNKISAKYEKKLNLNRILIIPAFVTIAILLTGPVSAQEKKKGMAGEKERIVSNESGRGPILEIEFTKGPSHNHPLMAVWVEDTAGNYIQSLFVARSIAKGTFRYVENRSGEWSEGEARRPAALPYWGHQRGVKAEDGLYIPDPDNPLPDAYSGATPKGSFILETRLDEPASEVFKVLFEINQPWDWNDYWSNPKYPDDEAYRTSSQPAVIYSATVNLKDDKNEYPMKVAGRAHHSGRDGRLYQDTETLTTALEITDSIVVRVREN